MSSRRTFNVIVVLGVIACLCRASDDTAIRDVAGGYMRVMLGLYSEWLTLKPDGTYVLITRFDVGSDQESGTWKVQSSMVVLSAKKRGEVFKMKPARFQIIHAESELHLKVRDDPAYQDDDPLLIFRPEKKRANKAPATVFKKQG